MGGGDECTRQHARVSRGRPKEESWKSQTGVLGSPWMLGVARGPRRVCSRAIRLLYHGSMAIYTQTRTLKRETRGGARGRGPADDDRESRSQYTGRFAVELIISRGPGGLGTSFSALRIGVLRSSDRRKPAEPTGGAVPLGTSH